MQLPSIIRSIYIRPDRLDKPVDSATVPVKSRDSSPLNPAVVRLNRNRATSLKTHPTPVIPDVRKQLDHLTISPRPVRRWNSLRRSKSKRENKSPSPKKKVLNDTTSELPLIGVTNFLNCYP